MIDKDRPSREWIEAVRRRYPCEREIDRVLTRKMTRRAGGPFVPVTLERLCDGLRSLLRAETARPFEISGAKWLAGGASKLQMVFDLVRDGSKESLVLRMEPAESVVETSRLREFQLLAAIAGRIPAPRPLWVDVEGKHLPYPGLVYSWAPGVTKPTGASSGVTGVGIVGSRHRRSPDEGPETATPRGPPAPRLCPTRPAQVILYVGTFTILVVSVVAKWWWAK